MINFSRASKNLVDLRADALHRRHVAELPLDDDPVLQVVVQQGEARLQLLAQVHRLPDAVLAPCENAEVAHDLARPLGALPDALDHGVEILERIVDLPGFPLALHPLPLGLGKGDGAVPES